MMNRSTREPASSSRRPLRILLATLAIVGLGWAGIGLDPANLNLDGWRWIVEADSPQPRLVRVFAHDGGIGDIAWSPDGEKIAAGGLLHNALMIWDANTGALVRRLDREHGSISSVAWSPDGRYVAAGRWFTEVSLGHVALNVWDASTGRRLHALVGPLPLGQGANNVPSRSLAFSPDSRLLAAGHRGAISIHDVETGQLKQILRGHRAVGIVLAFGHSRMLATGGPDRVAPVQTFDVETGASLRAFAGDRETPFAIAYRPDGRVVATADFQRPVVTLWDAQVGNPTRDLPGHTAPIRALAYSPDGRFLASAAPGGGVIVWNAHSGERVTSLPNAKDLVYAIAFSPDARYLAAPVDKQVRVWDLSRVLPPRP